MKAQQHPSPSDDASGDANATAATAPDGALATGAVLGALRIRRVLAQHGDETIYTGFNDKLQRRFALREYFPRALSRRTDRGTVLQLRSAGDAVPFSRGLNAFLERARKRAELAQGTLLGIRRVWEENGTAYLCMPYPRTQNLVEMRAARGRPPDESWLRERLLDPLLAALGQLHGVGLLHGRLAPEQVLILPEARTLLLDFASAPSAAGEGGGDGAPPGPWDDLRALAQVVSFAMLGAPAGSQGLATALRELAARSGGVPAYSDSLMNALAAALATGPEGAVRSVEDFSEMLAGRAAVATAAAPAAATAPAAEDGANAAAEMDHAETGAQVEALQGPNVLHHPSEPGRVDPSGLPAGPGDVDDHPGLGEMPAWHGANNADHAAGAAGPVVRLDETETPAMRADAAPAIDAPEPVGEALQRATAPLKEAGGPEVAEEPAPPMTAPAPPAPAPAPSPQTTPLRIEPILAEEERVADLQPALAYRPEGYPPRPRRPGRAVWLALVVALAAAGAGGLVWQSRHTPQLAQNTPGSAELAPAAGASASPATPSGVSATEPVAAPSTTAAMPESTRDAGEIASGAPGSTSVTASGVGAARGEAVAALAAVSSAAEPAPAPTTTAGTGAAPQRASTKPAQAVASPPPPALPSSPRAACGDRTNFALYNCMQKQCRLKPFTAHEQCVLLRERDVVE